MEKLGMKNKLLLSKSCYVAIARHEAIQIESFVSGLLRSARNDGDLYRHHSFLQGIFPMPVARNDIIASLK